MKVTTPFAPVEPLAEPGDSRDPLPALPAPPSLLSDLSQLTKARLTVMVSVTTVAGYALASRGTFDWPKLIHTLVGTTLVAICSSILNQAMERRIDALMSRTEQRPFVTRRLPFVETIIAGVIFGGLGLLELAWFVGSLSTLLTAVTLLVYLVVYTPLKRITPLNTLIGAIPGALPPLIGATAARGHFSTVGWTLFALLALWQLPHFYAIAWLYRQDYRAAGLRMVSTDDEFGRSTGLHAIVSALILFPASLLPVLVGNAGIFYGVVATLLSLFFIVMAFRFARQPNRPSARALFLTSIAYLPLILIALAVDIPLRHAFGAA